MNEITFTRGGGASCAAWPRHGQGITILRKADSVIDALHEPYAPAGPGTPACYVVASAQWASRWPAEELRAAHRPERESSGDG